MPFRAPAQVPQTGRRPACFPSLLAPNKDREIGGGRATRQPGQVRKEAALTRSGSGRSSVSYLFFRANRAKMGGPVRRSNSPLHSATPASRDNQSSGSIDDRSWRFRNAPQRPPERRS